MNCAENISFNKEIKNNVQYPKAIFPQDTCYFLHIIPIKMTVYNGRKAILLQLSYKMKGKAQLI